MASLKKDRIGVQAPDYFPVASCFAVVLGFSEFFSWKESWDPPPVSHGGDLFISVRHCWRLLGVGPLDCGFRPWGLFGLVRGFDFPFHLEGDFLGLELLGRVCYQKTAGSQHFIDRRRGALAQQPVTGEWRVFPNASRCFLRSLGGNAPVLFLILGIGANLKMHLWKQFRRVRNNKGTLSTYFV
jgi:hypothetical protein